MFALPRSRSRLQTGLIGLLLIAATIVAALLTVTGGASAQTLPLTRSMTATYDALTQQVTYTVTLTNPDAAPQGTTIFVFPDAPLLAAPLPGSHADWVFNNPTPQLTLAPIPPGGTVVLPLVLPVGAVPDTTTVLSAFLEVFGNPNLTVDLPVFEVGLITENFNVGPLVAGGVWSMRHIVSNLSLSAVSVDTTVSSPVPAQTTFDPLQSSIGWMCTNGGVGPAVCTFPLPLSPGGVEASSFGLRIDDDHPSGTLTLTSALATVIDLDASNNTSVVTQQIVARQLRLAVFDAFVQNAELPAPGDTLDYRYILQAITEPAFEALTTLTTTVPAGTTFVAAGSDVNWLCAGGGAAGSVCTLTLTFPVAVPGEPQGSSGREVDFVVRIDADHPRDVPIINTVSLPVPPGDPTPDDNTRTVVTSLAASFDLGLGIVPPVPPTPAPGETHTFVYLVLVQAVDRGSSTGAEFTLTTTVPDNTTFVSPDPDAAIPDPDASDGRWDCGPEVNAPAGTVCTATVTLPDLSTLPFAELFFVVRIDSDLPPDTVIRNTVRMSVVGDTDPSNNTDTSEITLAAVVEAPPFFSPELGALVPPHLFFGSDAQFEGQPAADGETVLAINETGLQVGRASVKSDGSWSIQVSPAQAKTVAFTIGQSTRSQDFDVSSGQLTDVSLDLDAPAVRDTGDWTPGLFTLDDDGGPVPEFTTDDDFPPCFLAEAGTLCTDRHGNISINPDLSRPPTVPASFGEDVPAWGTAAGSVDVAGCDFIVCVESAAGAYAGSEVRVAQGAAPLFAAPFQLTARPGPLDSDPAGLVYVRVTQDATVPLPTTVDYAAGTASAPADREGSYTLLVGSARDIALPAGIAALGFHGAPGTPPALIQGQLAHPSALQAMFQFRNGAWLIFRPGGLAILNSLTSIDANAPLFLSLSRATRWAGPLLFFGDRDVPIASGFTAVTYSGLQATTPDDLLTQFARPSAVTAIFLFDNELNAGQGGYRTFRTAGPSFLNDLAMVQPYDVFFVLTERATSLSIPEFVLPE